jgi:hypothetical protein
VADPTLPPVPATGATRFELLDLERRIAERGLQLRRVFGFRAEFPRNYSRGPDPVPLSDYEETLIRTALLAMAERLVP